MYSHSVNTMPISYYIHYSLHQGLPIDHSGFLMTNIHNNVPVYTLFQNTVEERYQNCLKKYIGQSP